LAVSRKDFEELVKTLDSVIWNLDTHLKNDHGQEAHGYNSKTKIDATLRFYLANCSHSLKALLGKKES
jgi:hypothetical protein